MNQANIKEASVCFDMTDEHVHILFENLPRQGDYIRYENKSYLVARVVFNVIDSSLGVVGYPNIYCFSESTPKASL